MGQHTWFYRRIAQPSLNKKKKVVKRKATEKVQYYNSLIELFNNPNTNNSRYEFFKTNYPNLNISNLTIVRDEYELVIYNIDILKEKKLNDLYSELAKIPNYEGIFYKEKPEYFDIFKTNKRNLDNTYLNKIIKSKEECFDWIENPHNQVYFKDKIECLIKLDEFWNKYPDGIIVFG